MELMAAVFLFLKNFGLQLLFDGDLKYHITVLSFESFLFEK